MLAQDPTTGYAYCWTFEDQIDRCIAELEAIDEPELDEEAAELLDPEAGDPETWPSFWDAFRFAPVDGSDVYQPTSEDLADLDLWLAEIDAREYQEAMSLADIADAIYAERHFTDYDLSACGLVN